MAQVLFDEATRVYPGAEIPARDDLGAADGEFLVLEEPPAADNPPHCVCSPAWNGPKPDTSRSANATPITWTRNRPRHRQQHDRITHHATTAPRRGIHSDRCYARPSAYPRPNNSSAPWQFSAATRQHCDSSDGSTPQSPTDSHSNDNPRAPEMVCAGEGLKLQSGSSELSRPRLPVEARK